MPDADTPAQKILAATARGGASLTYLRWACWRRLGRGALWLDAAWLDAAPRWCFPEEAVCAGLCLPILPLA